MEQGPLYHPWCIRLFKSPVIIIGFLFLLLALIRGYGLFGPLPARIFILWNFFLMWFLPFLFLTKQGRIDIGIKKPDHPLWLIWGVIFGLGISFLYFLLGFGLYGRTINNWFVNIGTQFLPADTTSWGLSRFELFIILTTPAIVFSPIGEEFFFRGMIHSAIQHKHNATVAGIVNGLAFSGIHLLHHGLLLTTSGIQILWLPGLLFFLLMFLLSWVLTTCRIRSGSLWPAVICHAAFNFMMNITLFLFLM